MTLLALFRRFLGFGFQAFGGPVAQIGVLKQHLVDEERWIEPERFRRVLGVYQAMPGPEATELCVHFGMLRAGRIGGFLAGLGFMLPGFVLMVAAAALYARAIDSGGGSETIAMLSAGAAPAAVALMTRGGYRIATGALTHPLLIVGAIVAGAAELLGIPFWIGLLVAALLSELRTDRGRPMVLAGLVGPLAAAVLLRPDAVPQILSSATDRQAIAPVEVSLLFLFGVGLRGGLLTFGGAYTAIPFVRNLVVLPDGFVSDLVFLDGVAVGNLLPAPLVIFATFVGYLGAGLPGAIVTTIGMFLPAFALTLLGFDLIERIVEEPRIHALLDGITAGVLGIVAVTILRLGSAAFLDLRSALAGAVAAVIVFGWKSPYASPAAIGAGIAVALAFATF